MQLNRPVQTRFRCAYTYRLKLAAYTKSLTHYTKGTPSRARPRRAFSVFPQSAGGHIRALACGPDRPGASTAHKQNPRSVEDASVSATARRRSCGESQGRARGRRRLRNTRKRLTLGEPAPTACRHPVSGLFHSPHRGAFHLSLTVLVHYRSLRST